MMALFIFLVIAMLIGLIEMILNIAETSIPELFRLWKDG